MIDPDWIEQALQTAGTASIWRRRLPAEHVVWLVIGLALFRNEPIWHIVRQLVLSLNTAADAQRYRTDLLADHYRQRWEIELGCREIKQGFLAGETTLRSKQPMLVRQFGAC